MAKPRYTHAIVEQVVKSRLKPIVVVTMGDATGVGHKNNCQRYRTPQRRSICYRKPLPLMQHLMNSSSEEDPHSHFSRNIDVLHYCNTIAASMMPYIKPEERPRYDQLIQQVVEQFRTLSPGSLDGHLNYFITKLLVNLYEPSYFNFNRVQGLLGCIQQEFYRRRVAPYEDDKMEQHGDVY